MTQAELIEKAAITTDAIAAAGGLSPLQADRFLDFVFDETQLKALGVRTVKFSREKMLIEKINVANRVAVAADEAADPGLRRGISTDKIEITPKEIMVPFEISDLIKDENIEGNDIEEHIIKLMATRLANNIEELYLDGNLLGPAAWEGDLIEGGAANLVRKDRYLALFDGLLRAAEAGHVVDAEGGPLVPTLVSRALRNMPNKFRKNRTDLRFLTSWDHEQHYREGVSARADGAGASALQGNMIQPFGTQLYPMSLLSPEPLYVENSVANSDGSTPTALAHAPIDNVIIAPTSLNQTAVAPFVEGVDYSLDKAAGTWTRLGGGAIGSGATVKVTYTTAGRAILTMPKNIIIAIGRDVTIEKDRNIFKRVNEFAIHAKVYVTFEEVDAVVLVKNIQVPT